MLIMVLSLDNPIVFIDLETTGTNRQQDRIVEIAVTKIKPDGNTESFDSLVDPNIPIPPEASQIHGLTNDDVRGHPTFDKISSQILSFVEGCDFAGFSVEFDLSILEAEFRRAGICFSCGGRKILDVKKIYKKLDPRDLSTAYSKYCGKELDGAHRATVDVQATIDVLLAQLNMHEELPRDVDGLQEFCNPPNPAWIDKEGKLIWYNEQATMNFGGKHMGKTLEEVAKNSPDYLSWMLGASFSQEVKEIIKNALEGKFPKPPEGDK